MATATFGNFPASSPRKSPLVSIFVIFVMMIGAYMLIMANKHAINNHGSDAEQTENCWNNNGTWKAFRVGNTEFHLLCMDNGTIRDVILERESNTSPNFHVKNMFTPKDGTWKRVQTWLMNKNAVQVNVPNPMNVIP